MAIFDRFNRVLKSNLNSLVDRAEDPGKLLDQTVIEMETELKRSRQDLVTQLGTAKRLEKKVGEANEEVTGWENKAVLALRAGDEDLAREGAADGGQRFGGGTLDELEHLSGRIDQLEAEVEAADVLDPDPHRASVEQRFRDLEKKSGGAVVEDELSALKKRLEGK